MTTHINRRELDILTQLAAAGAVVDTRGVELGSTDALDYLYFSDYVDISRYTGWYLTPKGAQYCLKHGIAIKGEQ